ncbi:MAG: DALR domain-containing protein, partial [Planctomycetota bacterium]
EQLRGGDVEKKAAKQLKELKGKFEEAMNDDLNTSVALSVLFELVRFVNGLLEDSSVVGGTLMAVDDLFSKLGGDCLGIVKEVYPEAGGASEAMIDELVRINIKQRAEARNRNDFAAADAIRAMLEEAGIVLEDKPEGTEWRMK